MRLVQNLYRHQADELQYLLSSTAHRALFWEMGAGKTPVVARLGCAVEAPKLYVCPASIKDQVARELVRWGSPGTRVQVVRGRQAALSPDADWIVVNYDLLLSDDVFGQLIERPWALLVLDESHLLRTPSAQRTRRVFGHRPCLAGQADRVVLLSGTPVVNSPFDLFPAVNRLFPQAIAIPDGKGGLRRLQQAEFVARFCLTKTINIGRGRSISTIAGGRNLDELRARLAPSVSRLRRTDVLDLPPIRINEFALTVDDTSLRDAEAQVPPGLALALQQAIGDDDALLALLQRHAPALATLRRLLGTLKAGAAIERINERLAAGEDRVLAFFHHRDVGDAMLAGLQVKAAMINGNTSQAARTRAIDAIDTGRVQVLLLQNQSGSLGLNLQCARYACIVEPDWTEATTQQAISRIYRAGQTRDVEIEFLLIPNSLDEHIVGVARRKAAIAADLIETPIEETT